MMKNRLIWLFSKPETLMAGAIGVMLGLSLGYVDKDKLLVIFTALGAIATFITCIAAVMALYAWYHPLKRTEIKEYRRLLVQILLMLSNTTLITGENPQSDDEKKSRNELWLAVQYASVSWRLIEETNSNSIQMHNAWVSLFNDYINGNVDKHVVMRAIDKMLAG
ncbi:hypothetical protein IG604_18155 [Vibrio cholerae]|nr:hypothetical protein [Vibrio cholerae]